LRDKKKIKISKRYAKAGTALRRKLKHIDDLNSEFPEKPWVTLLRMHYKPVYMIRQNKETVEPLLSHGLFGDRIWKVGAGLMTEDEAMCLAEKIRTSNQEPRWGTLDGRFGCGFLDDDQKP